MEIKPRELEGTYEVHLDPRRDERGYFIRTYDEAFFRECGLVVSWVQENQSLSLKRGVLRGLHFQAPPHAETKLVRVVQGAIFDVFVDLRRNSPTYGQWDAIELSAEDFKAVYISKGFAHGYCTLADDTVVAYKTDSPYAPESEGGVRWNDEALAIRWPLQNPILSLKDSKWPPFREFVSPFVARA
jgi:dTDP-4-dehydrorhamnose 3,5-epimerase